MPNALTTTQPAGQTFRIPTENGAPLEVAVGSGVGGGLQVIGIDFTDDDGIVGPNAVVTHGLAIAVLATDKVLGVNVPGASVGSGLQLLAGVVGAGSVDVSYINGTGSSTTNGSVTYTLLVAR